MRTKSTALSTTIASWIPKLSLPIVLLVFLVSPSLVQAEEGKPEVKIVEQKVDEKKVTLRIQVRDEKKRPVSNLERKNFQVFVDKQKEPVTINSENWKDSEETEPPPAWIIFLLDMSGSMDQLDGGNSSITKLQGAIGGIRQFSKNAATRGKKTQVAVVPFGKGGGGCKGFPVTPKELNEFYPAGSDELEKKLNKIESTTPCASTNLYQPLINAVDFLNNKSDERFYVKGSRERQPRLSIILMSDGFHNDKEGLTKQNYMEKLKERLGDQEEIIVHSLGYGYKPIQLGKMPEYNLRDSEGNIRPATIRDIKSNGGDIPDEKFVDVKALDAIASLTQGFCAVSKDAQALSKTLRRFLDSLLGEYEIAYTHKDSRRAARHEARVVVNGHMDKVESKPEPYRITVFGLSVPLLERIPVLGLTVLGLGIGGASFRKWGEKLQRNLMDD